jgi:hypothetical protein
MILHKIVDYLMQFDKLKVHNNFINAPIRECNLTMGTYFGKGFCTSTRAKPFPKIVPMTKFDLYSWHG